MSRHHVVIGLALVLGVCAWAVGSVVMAVGVGAGLVTLIGFGVAFPQWKMFGPFICRGSSRKRWIALTFDDGPDPRSTPALLEALREAKVEAAFFCVGQKVAAHPDLAARIAREGHLVENHSYHHSNGTNFFTTSHLLDELARTQTVIEKATGKA